MTTPFPGRFRVSRSQLPGRARRARVALAVALGAACAEPPAPLADGPALLRASAEAYVLQTVAGETVPATSVINDRVTVTAVADTIWLAADGVGERASVERSSSEATVPPGETTSHRRHAFRYSVKDGVFEASYPCPESASCVAPPHLRGTLTGRELTLTYALYYRTPLVYRLARGAP